MSRWMLLTFITVISGAFDLSPTYAADTLRQVALVIGNESYDHVRTLNNPGNDARLVAAKLKAAGYKLVGESEQVNLSLSQFNAAIEKFADAARNSDVALLYYAGHGVQIKGENYLIPTDANPGTETQAAGQSVNVSDILRILGSMKTKINFFILDACRDNPFLDRPLYAASRAISVSDTGLSEVVAPQGTIIWYATSPGRKAQDGIGSNGPYAASIAQFIDINGLDVYGFFNRTGLKVFRDTKRAQQPWLASSAIPGTYFFHSANGSSAFVLYDVDGELARGAERGDLVSRLFSEGIAVPGREFPFGLSAEAINSRLDSMFEERLWSNLPIASEFIGEDVRYVSTELPSLPVVQSALLAIDPGSHNCIDPNSKIVFFFKDQRFFHASIRLRKSDTCPSYGWLKRKILGEQDRKTIETGTDPVEVLFHDTGSYTVIEVTQAGIANPKASVWNAE